MFRGKPIIGIVGGIGSGKSYIARLFGEAGCQVIDSDAQVREAYADPDILAAIRTWWGPGAFRADGSIDRSAVAKIVFADPAERQRLEQLLHPRVGEKRKLAMAGASPDVRAFVWDAPLLLEAGLNTQCDAIVFVDAPMADRLQRVRDQRHWDAGELNRREKLQLPLDTKRKISDYLIVNTAGADDLRGQVRQILSRIVTSD